MSRFQITTNASVLSVPRREGQVEYPVSKITGLTLRVSAAGAKSWTLRYRTLDGRQCRLTLGRYPTLGLAEARGKAQKALGLVADGGDPAQARRKAKSEAHARTISTVSDLIEAYFEDARRGRHRPNGRPKRASTLKLEREYFDSSVRPKLGRLKVHELSRSQVQRFLNTISERAPASARHCRNLIRQAYNYGIRQELVERNPAQLAEVSAPGSRERVLTDKELKAIWTAAAAPQSIEGLSLALSTGLAIRLAMVTLQRGGEICGLHADEIDRDRMLWTIPGIRTKNHQTHVVPLSQEAIDLLDQAFMIARRPNEKRNDWSGFAFPAVRGAGSLTRHAFTRAVKRLTSAIGIEDARPHDFRRTGSTHITSEQIAMPRFIVSRVLNQVSDTGGAAIVTGVYDRNEYLADKRRALSAWADVLGNIVSRGEVVCDGG